VVVKVEEDPRDLVKQAISIIDTLIMHSIKFYDETDMKLIEAMKLLQEYLMKT